LSMNGFNVDTLDKKTAVFFEGWGGTNSIAKILIEQLIATNKKSKKEMAFILEDINNISKISGINELIEYASFNKVKSYFVTNSIEELKELYGKYTFDKISNTINMNDVENLIIDKTDNSVDYPDRLDNTIKIIDVNSFF